jgi:hypothetical protein
LLITSNFSFFHSLFWPFEEISAEEYEKRFAHLSDVDVTKIFENADNTDLSGEIACGSGGCELR